MTAGRGLSRWPRSMLSRAGVQGRSLFRFGEGRGAACGRRFVRLGRTVHVRRAVWLGLLVAMVATAVSVSGAFPVVSPNQAAALQASDRCDEGASIRVLFLLDTSRSLQGNDPEGKRASGTVDALEDLSGIVADYRARLRLHYPQWSVFAAVDTFSASHSDLQFHNPYSRASGDWKDVASPVNLEDLRQAARGVQQAPGYWTDYREALNGAIERFEEPAQGGVPTCDFLFWFTDGDHDTAEAGVLTDRERDQIDGMCRAGGVVDQLRQSDVNVTAIELRVDRESSEQLGRLVVGREGDCSGLGGKVADVASVSDLATQIEENVFQVVDPDYPDRFDDPCASSGESCDYRFALADDVEWIKVYVDLSGVGDPNGVSMVLHGPDGLPVAPFRFGDEWSLVPGTGMFGKQATPNISVIWAHQVSEAELGTEWGDSQVWSIRFSGSEAGRARAGIRTDERDRPSVEGLSVEGEDLSGRIIPAPTENERASVVLRLGAGQIIDVDLADRAVQADGRFSIPGIRGRIVRAMNGDGSLAANACVATVIVSLEKAVSYGTFSGSWSAPLSGSAADVRVPRALCGLEGRMTPLATLVEYGGEDAFDPSGSLRVTADGGLLDGELTVREVYVEAVDASTPADGVLGAWAQDWSCEVAADARGHTCEDPFVLNLGADSAAAIDVTLVLWASTIDSLQDPPLSESVSYTVRGVSLPGRLPTVTGAEVDGQFDPSGSLSVTVRGGWQDGIVSLDLGPDGVLDVADVDGPQPYLQPEPSWRCEVPAGATEHDCPPLRIDATVDDDTIADLSLPFIASSSDLERSRSLSAEVGAVPIRVRKTSEMLGILLTFLIVILAVFVVTRVLTAWMRRRWKPLGVDRYFVSTARRQGGSVVPDGDPRPAHCFALAKPRGAAALGNTAKLHVRWWPLLVGGQVEVVASPASPEWKLIASSGQLSGIRRDRPRAGRIGHSLSDGWAVLEARSQDGRYVLAFWDVHADAKDDTARGLWGELDRQLGEQEPAEDQSSVQPSEGDGASPSSSDDATVADAGIDPTRRRWPDPSRRSGRRRDGSAEE